MIYPDILKAEELAGQGNVIPVYKELFADLETPVSVWFKLFSDSSRSFLLESVSGEENVARYSFIGGDPYMCFTAQKGRWEIKRDNGDIETGDSDPVGKLRSLYKGYKPVEFRDLPRFSGGAVGYIGYDGVRYYEKIPDSNKDMGLTHDIFFGFYRTIVVFDSREQKIFLISNILTDEKRDIESQYRDAVSEIEKYEKQLMNISVSRGFDISITSGITSNMSKQEYEAVVEKCKEYILAGDIFQVVPSQRFMADVKGSSFDLYRVLRTVNPSPYMFYFRDGETSVVGASPEMLVRVENGNVETCPIAGTRKRGANEAEDERLAQELLNDEKEKAEHVMLIDLGRNDIGRVSSTGTVQIENMMHVEKFSHVMHIVTNVKGRLKPGVDALDAFFACFPTGTLTGAPKVRAMEIIDEVENLRRGLYGGAIGYIDFSGDMDTCIAIRTLIHDGRKVYIQSGAGIVADSVPANEFTEVRNKAQALFSAIEKAGDL
ncbi:MAG: anthranilate synthase component I [Chitinivibrionales bacterium]